MAALFEAVDSSDTLYFNFPLQVEKSGDGSVTVYGKCTGDDLDLDDQIIDKDFAREALQKWFKDYANIRQMHSTQLPPGGKGVKLEEKPDGFYLKARVVEPGAIKLVNEGVYSAYSIGISRPTIVLDPIARGGRVTGGIVSEVSLVDFPANPTTKFVMANEREDVMKVMDLTKAPRSNDEEPKPLEESEESDELDEKTLDSDIVKFCGVDDCEVCADLPVEKKKLTTEERHDLSDSDFVFPKERKYPIPDESHARNALARVSQHGTAEEKAKVRAAVRRKFPSIDVGGEDSDKAQESEVIKVEAETVEGTSALETAIEHAKSGDMAKAVEALQRAVNADLAVTTTSPASTELTTVEVSGDGLSLDGVGAAKVESPEVVKDDGSGGGDGDDEDDDADTVENDESPSATKSLSDYGIGVQYKVRQLHDALCPVYEWDQVVAAHPNLAKNGVAAALGPTATHLLYQMLSHEVHEDGGTGKHVAGVEHIACAYVDLLDFLAHEAAEAATSAVLTSVRADLHKAFEQDYPTVTSISPLTFDAGDAHRFGRGYLRDGRTPAFGTKTHVKLPSGEHQPEASEFQRGPLSSGHERVSPVAGTPSRQKDIESDIQKVYEDPTRELTRETMTTVHDHLAAQFPKLCPCGPERSFGLHKAYGERYEDRILGTNPQTLSPTKLDTSGRISQGAGAVKESSNDTYEHPTGHGPSGDLAGAPALGAKESPAVPSMKTLDLLAEGVASPEEVRAALAKIPEMDTTKALTEVRDQLRDTFTAITSQIATLQKRLEVLEKQPDPAQAPWRGAAGALEKLLKSHEEKPEESALSEVDKLAFDERKERVEYLVRVMNGSDPHARLMAQSELRKLYG